MLNYIYLLTILHCKDFFSKAYSKWKVNDYNLWRRNPHKTVLQVSADAWNLEYILTWALHHSSNFKALLKYILMYVSKKPWYLEYFYNVTEGGTRGGEIKIRVDDELKAYVDGQVKADAFSQPGWQWTTIWTLDATNAKIVAFRMFNQVLNLSLFISKLYNYWILGIMT